MHDDEHDEALDPNPTVEVFSRNGGSVGTITPGDADAEDAEAWEFPEDDQDEPAAARPPAPRPAPRQPVPPPAPVAPVAPQPKLDPRKIIAGLKKARGFVGRCVEGHTGETNDNGGIETIAATVGFAMIPQDAAKLRRMIQDASEQGAKEAADIVREAMSAVPLTSPEVERLESRVAEHEQKAAELTATGQNAKAEARRMLRSGEGDPTAQEDVADAAAVELDRVNRRLATLRVDLQQARSLADASRSAELVKVKRSTVEAVRKVVSERAALLESRLAALVMGRLAEIHECRGMLGYAEAQRG